MERLNSDFECKCNASPHFSQLCVYISQCDFMSQDCDFISHNMTIYLTIMMSIIIIYVKS